MFVVRIQNPMVVTWIKLSWNLPLFNFLLFFRQSWEEMSGPRIHWSSEFNVVINSIILEFKPLQLLTFRSLKIQIIEEINCDDC